MAAMQNEGAGGKNDAAASVVAIGASSVFEGCDDFSPRSGGEKETEVMPGSPRAADE
jgi:hypothetical protein